MIDWSVNQLRGYRSRPGSATIAGVVWPRQAPPRSSLTTRRSSSSAPSRSSSCSVPAEPLAAGDACTTRSARGGLSASEPASGRGARAPHGSPTPSASRGNPPDDPGAQRPPRAPGEPARRRRRRSRGCSAAERGHRRSHDPALVEEVRQLVVARNERRERQRPGAARRRRRGARARSRNSTSECAPRDVGYKPRNGEDPTLPDRRADAPAGHLLQPADRGADRRRRLPRGRQRAFRQARASKRTSGC